MIGNNNWNIYKGIINRIHDEFNQQEIIWRRFTYGLSRYGEGDNKNYVDVPLKCLLGYNDFRTWPITDTTLAGTLDKQNMYALINLKYLSELGYLSNQRDKYLDINLDHDYFIYQGQKWLFFGETPVAQAKDEPLLFQVILQIGETQTNERKY